MTNEEFFQKIQRVIEEDNGLPGRHVPDLDLQLLDCDTEGGQYTIDYLYVPKERHLNPYGGVHGGMIASIFDTGIGIGAIALKQQFVTTIDLSVSYLRALLGEQFRVHAEFTHLGNRTVSGIGKVFDLKTGELGATCLATYITIRGKEKGLQV